MRRTPDPAAIAEEARVAAALAAGEQVERRRLAAAVRTSLARLAHAHPGRLVEVRVPPFAAVQVGVAGVPSTHTRGTPPHVVETDPATWLALASGRLTWAEAVAGHRVSASGVHADLSELLGSPKFGAPHASAKACSRGDRSAQTSQMRSTS